ncbi:hypothetical protein BGX34_008806 [Mortierella sp. NVP85]|nr:hypothetical protein BGX34_008806 [Mortierella sp. NVP85]
MVSNNIEGPGERSSETSTSHYLNFSGTNITGKLMEARDSCIARQAELSRVSDLLALNFIFDKDFVKEHAGVEAAEHFFEPPLKGASGNDLHYVSLCTVVAARVQDSTAFEKEKPKLGDNDQPSYFVQKAIECLTVDVALWAGPSYRSALNEEGYQSSFVNPILRAFAGALNLPTFPSIDDHVARIQYNLDYTETLTPNFMAAVHHNGVQYALCIAEIKKPGTNDVCEVLSIHLASEAVYFVQELGAFNIPKDNKDLGRLISGLSVLSLAKDLVQNTKAAFEKRRAFQLNNNRRQMRPSFHVFGRDTSDDM